MNLLYKSIDFQSSEIESRLIAQADAQGKSVEDLLSSLIEGFLKSSGSSNISMPDSHGKAERFLNWANSRSVSQTLILSDLDISRESIYTREDRML